jgi:S-adenosylmethionine:tRNA ribosyltransferase-isomerase
LSGPADDERFRTDRYDYVLPQELIAQHPAQRRDESRLLVLDGDRVTHARFSDLPTYVRPGDVFVANDARVLRARFLPRRRGGGKAQVLLLHPVEQNPVEQDVVPERSSSSLPDTWEALVRPGQRVRVGDRLTLRTDAGFEIIGRTPLGTRLVRFYGVSAVDAMAEFGNVPLPPYIKTPPENAAERYQTVYAARDGSVAAPTAGLHFTQAIIDEIRARGAQWRTITLDVGAGTFRPVKADDIREHPMHAERYEISESVASAVRDAKRSGGRVIAVGTTSVRSLEDAALRNASGVVEAGARWTDLFIYPGFQFRVIDALLTNFHLPRSTLLMLVCAFAGTERVLAAYREAIDQRYRFYSFGDAMLVLR